jgi:protein O-mannosyl-transferase
MLWEMNPVAFHLTNLALRWLNGCLLFAVLKKAGVPMELAAYTVLVWLTLPINSEVVAWVSARAYLLAALFVLVSALLAELFLERRRTIAVASYTLTALLALLSH